ncbi:MAG: Holliday junction resolvase RuvX [Firmicutes bacterium]|jgi:putative Holliday junction resolvase|nr:Holliday junction resolvase RuvX [Bacillota bacterium]
MALDIGDRRTGVAVSDELGITAQGLCVIEARETDSLVGRVMELAARHNVGLIVLGLPLNMNGTAGERAEKVKMVASRLRERADVEVGFWDERLTTVQANRALLEADLGRKRRKRAVDVAAAVLVLQAFLDRRRGERPRD